MKKLIDLLIVVGILSVAAGVVVKLKPSVCAMGYVSCIGPNALWKLAIGCLVIAIALSLRQK